MNATSIHQPTRRRPEVAQARRGGIFFGIVIGGFVAGAFLFFASVLKYPAVPNDVLAPNLPPDHKPPVTLNIEVLDSLQEQATVKCASMNLAVIDAAEIDDAKGHRLQFKCGFVKFAGVVRP